VTSEDDVLRMPEGVVTGEAVLLDLRPASFLTRGLALLLDAVVLAAVGTGLGFAVVLATSGLDDAAQAASSLAVVVLVLVVLPTAWEALTRGRSPGKAAAGLRVVRDDGGPVRARQAVVRALVGVGELWMAAGSIAVIASLASPRGKRVGDLLAGTVVVRERASAPPHRPLVMPPELAGWARGADIGRLPDALATSVRSVLDRADRLHPESRARLLAELAGQVGALVAPPPPPGTPPERLLAAVLAERRSRDTQRLLRARERRDSLAVESRRLQGL
jgi:uncharacterized RDD family membrane protein YckC